MGVVKKMFWCCYATTTSAVAPSVDESEETTDKLRSLKDDSFALNGLLKCEMVTKRDKYSFLRCLLEPDQEIFSERYVHLVFINETNPRKRRNMIEIGAIHMLSWRKIMTVISEQLGAKYCLHRHTIWDEKEKGETVIVDTFGSGAEVVHILFSEEKLERFVPKKIALLMSVNLHYNHIVWDSIVE